MKQESTTVNRKGIKVGDTVVYGEQRYIVSKVNERAVMIFERWVNDQNVTKEVRKWGTSSI